jgi:hypothetical protein
VWATASQVKAWLLIEVHGSWGRDAVVDSELGPHAPKIWRDAMRARGVRVITIRRDLETHHHESTPDVRLVHVVGGRPGVTPARAWRMMVGDLHQVVTATESLASEGVTGPGWEDDPEPYALVCTNGRHDPCCATLGRPLARGLRRSAWAGRVWECSHIGGDRFAGNLLLLPESLYFGRCDEAGGEQVLAAFDGGRIDLAHYRGRSTQSLVEQAAEHFVRTQYSLDAIDAIARVESRGNGQVSVHLAGAENGPLVVTLGRARTPSPTPLTCKGAEGLTYPAFELAAIEDGR